MRHAAAALAALALLAPAAARAGYPKGSEVDPRENPAWGPLEVCSEMVKAETDRRYDDLAAHLSFYARARLGLLEKVALRVARKRLVGAQCLSYKLVDASHADVSMRSPNGESSNMPFLREEGVWRFDQFRWQQLRKAGKAAQP